ncbi:MAG: HEAT repeat domain-containing protein [Phormidesmis sp.]
MTTPPSPEAQADTDRLIDYVNEQIELLSFEQIDADLLKKMVQSLADPRRAARIGLIDALGQIGEPATPFLLEGLANHPDQTVRKACCHALASADEEASVAGLVDALLNDVDIGVKSAAAGALAKVGAPAFEAIRAVLASESASETCKGHAAWVMASMSNEVSDRLYQIMDDPSAAVRTAAVGAIAQLAQQQLAAGTAPSITALNLPSASLPAQLPASAQGTLSLLIKALEDSDADVRIEAAAHLARLDYQAAYQPLVACLTDVDWEVRKAAVLALGKLGNVAAVEAIAPLKKDPERAVQSIAELVIRQIESRSASSSTNSIR